MTMNLSQWEERLKKNLHSLIRQLSPPFENYRKYLSCIRHRGWWVLSVLSVWIAIIGIPPLWWSISPAVTIEVGPVINEFDATLTGFNIQNNRGYPITDITNVCVFNVRDTGFHEIKSAFLNKRVTHRLGAYSKTAVFCPVIGYDGAQIDGKTLIDGYLALSVQYNTPLPFESDIDDSQIFTLRRNRENKAIWIPQGGARGLIDVSDFVVKNQSH